MKFFKVIKTENGFHGKIGSSASYDSQITATKINENKCELIRINRIII